MIQTAFRLFKFLAVILCWVAPAVAQEYSPELRDNPVLFRWYDKVGTAHDTTDASTIPPGARFESRDSIYSKVDPKKKRSWWRARKARLDAELHAAVDAWSGAQAAAAAARQSNEPAARLVELDAQIAKRQVEVQRIEKAITDFQAEAAKAKIPPRWVQ